MRVGQAGGSGPKAAAFAAQIKAGAGLDRGDDATDADAGKRGEVDPEQLIGAAERPRLGVASHLWRIDLLDGAQVEKPPGHLQVQIEDGRGDAAQPDAPVLKVPRHLVRLRRAGAQDGERKAVGARLHFDQSTRHGHLLDERLDFHPARVLRRLRQFATREPQWFRQRRFADHADVQQTLGAAADVGQKLSRRSDAFDFQELAGAELRTVLEFLDAHVNAVHAVVDERRPPDAVVNQHDGAQFHRQLPRGLLHGQSADLAGSRQRRGVRIEEKRPAPDKKCEPAEDHD